MRSRGIIGMLSPGASRDGDLGTRNDDSLGAGAAGTDVHLGLVVVADVGAVVGRARRARIEHPGAAELGWRPGHVAAQVGVGHSATRSMMTTVQAEAAHSAGHHAQPAPDTATKNAAT